jgi:hypothetical protein
MAKVATVKAFPAIDKFIFEEPLYEKMTADPQNQAIAFLLYHPVTIDGHCPQCHRERTFETHTPFTPTASQPGHVGNYLHKARGFQQISASCTRDSRHVILVYFLIHDSVIQKVGQYPSLADVLLSELKPMTTAIDDQDRNELHKAIGLAAHGVGVGSYVYLRRVFERMIQNVFDRHKADITIALADFQTMRMADKIDVLKNFLPPLMVKHRAVYGHLSEGIHSLDEHECLKHFEVFKQATFMMLHQESERRAEIERGKTLDKALQAINSKPDEEDPAGEGGGSMQRATS